MTDFTKEVEAFDEGRVTTADGYRVRLYATDGGSSGNNLHGAYKNGNGNWISQAWSKDGKMLSTTCGSKNLVLQPVTETICLWINVYPGGSTTTHSSRTRADTCAGTQRLACFELNQKVEHGEGL